MDRGTIIRLYGGSNTGKTQTLQKVVQLLLGLDGIYPFEYDGDFSIHFKGCKILITTMGDDSTDLEMNVKFMKENEPWDVAISATHVWDKSITIFTNYGLTCAKTLKFRKKGYDEHTDMMHKDICDKAKELFNTISQIVTQSENFSDDGKMGVVEKFIGR